MYYSIRGTLVKKLADRAVLEQNGLAWELHISGSTHGVLPEAGQECLLYTYLYVREDLMMLYGFADEDEKAVFLRLISLTGIGPKNAMNILTAIRVEEFRKVILNGDVNRLKSLPGIGPKTAKRLLLELKEKMSDEELSSVLGGSGRDLPVSRPVQDALAALESLGFRRSEVQGSVEAVIAEDDSVSTEEIVRRVLKNSKR